MNQLREYGLKLLDFIRSLLAQIESLPIFERALMRLESLEPSRQALVKSTFRFAMLLILTFLILWPLYKVRETKKFISLYSDSLYRLQRVSNTPTDIQSHAQKPADWQNLPASNAQELENSLKDFMANIGVAEDLFTSRVDGLDRMELEIDDLTLKQALSLSYQMDGWHPSVLAENFEMKIHPQNVDRLQLKLTALVRSALPGGGESLDEHDHDFESSNHETYEAPPPPPPPESRFGGNDSPPPPPPDQNFDFDEPPPPPNFDDSVPPPPPPPSFDEDFDNEPPIYEEGSEL